MVRGSVTNARAHSDSGSSSSSSDKDTATNTNTNHQVSRSCSCTCARRLHLPPPTSHVAVARRSLAQAGAPRRGRHKAGTPAPRPSTSREGGRRDNNVHRRQPACLPASGQGASVLRGFRRWYPVAAFTLLATAKYSRHWVGCPRASCRFRGTDQVTARTTTTFVCFMDYLTSPYLPVPCECCAVCRAVPCYSRALDIALSFHHMNE